MKTKRNLGLFLVVNGLVMVGFITAIACFDAKETREDLGKALGFTGSLENYRISPGEI
jgi:hypothetical protein